MKSTRHIVLIGLVSAALAALNIFAALHAVPQRAPVEDLRPTVGTPLAPEDLEVPGAPDDSSAEDTPLAAWAFIPANALLLAAGVLVSIRRRSGPPFFYAGSVATLTIVFLNWQHALGRGGAAFHSRLPLPPLTLPLFWAVQCALTLLIAALGKEDWGRPLRSDDWNSLFGHAVSAVSIIGVSVAYCAILAAGDLVNSYEARWLPLATSVHLTLWLALFCSGPLLATKMFSGRVLFYLSVVPLVSLLVIIDRSIAAGPLLTHYFNDIYATWLWFNSLHDVPIILTLILLLQRIGLRAGRPLRRVKKKDAAPPPPFRPV